MNETLQEIIPFLKHQNQVRVKSSFRVRAISIIYPQIFLTQNGSFENSRRRFMFLNKLNSHAKKLRRTLAYFQL